MHLVVSGHKMLRMTLGTENSMSVQYLQMVFSFPYRMLPIFVSLAYIVYLINTPTNAHIFI